ncbi:hypothetical protein D3C75_1207010 [compost metagenome]
MAPQISGCSGRRSGNRQLFKLLGQAVVEADQGYIFLVLNMLRRIRQKRNGILRQLIGPGKTCRSIYRGFPFSRLGLGGQRNQTAPCGDGIRTCYPRIEIPDRIFYGTQCEFRVYA